MLNSGKGFTDEFEMEAVRFQERINQNSKLKTGVAQISSSVKKEGGAIVKAVKSKVMIATQTGYYRHTKFKTTFDSLKIFFSLS